MRHVFTSLALLLFALLITPALASAQDAGESLVVQQWVTNSPAGQIDVAIVGQGTQPGTFGAGEVRVSLVDQEGNIYKAQPSANSPVELSLSGVPAGSYSLIARGPNMVATYAIHVLGSMAEDVGAVHHQLVVSAAEMRINKVRGAVVRYMPSSVPFLAEFDAAAGSSMMKSLNPMRTMRVAQSGGGLSGAIYRAGLSEGNLVGAAKTNILIYQNRELVAQTVSADDGSFKIDTLAAGGYGLIAIGPDGFAVIGFTVVDELVAARRPETTGRLVALQEQTMQSGLEMQLAPAGSDSPAVDELLRDADPAAPEELPPAPEVPADLGSMAGPTSGPGGFSGGGGGGGIGGGGPGMGLLLGAGVAAAAFAADDDDRFIDLPPVTSPLTP